MPCRPCRRRRADRMGRGAGAEAHLAAPSFVASLPHGRHRGRRPWRDDVLLVVAANQEAALELEHEVALHCPTGRWSTCLRGGCGTGRRGRSSRGWPGAGRGRRGASGAHRRPASEPATRRPVVVVEATSLMEGVIPPRAAPARVSAGARVDFEELIRGLVALGIPAWTRWRTPGSSRCAGASSTSFRPPNVTRCG